MIAVVVVAQGVGDEVGEVGLKRVVLVGIYFVTMSGGSGNGDGIKKSTADTGNQGAEGDFQVVNLE